MPKNMAAFGSYKTKCRKNRSTNARTYGDKKGLRFGVEIYKGSLTQVSKKGDKRGRFEHTYQ